MIPLKARPFWQTKRRYAVVVLMYLFTLSFVAGCIPATAQGNPLFTAALNGDLQTVKDLIGSGADVNARAPQANNSTALMIAAYKGNIEMLHALLDTGAQVNVENDFGFTALILASQEGRTEAVQVLLEAGAEVNAKTTSDENAASMTALMLASERGHSEVVRTLLSKGADANIKSNDGRTALAMATDPAVKALLESANTSGVAANANLNTKKIIQGAQERLLALGYQPGAADGVMGAKAIAALKKFQSDHSVAVTGQLDRKTLDALGVASPASPSLTQQSKSSASEKVATKADSNSSEERDWLVATNRGTPESYIAFHAKYPNSAHLTVRTGAVSWGHAMGRDFNDSFGYVLGGVKIGDFSFDSVTMREAALLGIIKLRDNGNGTTTVVMEGVNPPSNATVLFKDGKVVACQGN
jgi:peptidoglycan hydrolase-like protein with peptidoglycan-binding domain